MEADVDREMGYDQQPDEPDFVDMINQFTSKVKTAKDRRRGNEGFVDSSEDEGGDKE